MVTIFSNLILDNMPLVLQTLIVKEDGTEEGVVNTIDFTGDISLSVTDNVATVNVVASGTPPLLPTTGTGTATGAVTGSLAGNALQVVEGANQFLSIDPTAAAEQSLIQAFNTTAGGNIGQVGANTSNTQGVFSVNAQFDGASEVASIVGTAQIGSSTIVHTADTHTFNGNGYDALALSNENFDLYAVTPQGDGNVANVSGGTTNTDATASILATFNDGVETASITAFADATTSTITHTADEHFFNGNVTGASLTTKTLMVSRNNFHSYSY